MISYKRDWIAVKFSGCRFDDSKYGFIAALTG